MTREEKEAIKGKAINDAMCSIENRVRHVYNQGFEEGKDYYIQKHGNAYNKGLEDAWECARKIIGLGEPTDVVGCAGLRNFICGYSASEAIAKLKEYEKRTKSMSKAYAEVKEWLGRHLKEELTDNSNQVKEKTDKNCNTCRYGNIPDCGVYPCNECKRATFSKWTPKQTEEQTKKSCDNCGHRFDVSCEILDSGECCVNEGKWIPKQTEERSREMTDYQKYINALRKCAKEHENDFTSFAHIRVSDLCRDTANLLEELEQESKQKTGRWIAGEYWSMGSGMGESYGYWYTCSECGNKIRGGYSECGDNYCSKCGAKMSEKSKECCYNKDDECQLGYGKCSSISNCFTFE